MPEPTPGYAATLAGQLTQRHPDLLSAEKDLAILRGRLEIVRSWIHDAAYDDTARRALAQALQLPEPRRERTP